MLTRDHTALRVIGAREIEHTVASVFGRPLVRRRRKPVRRRIAIGCRGRFVEVEIVWAKLAPFQRRERTRKPTIWDAIRGAMSMTADDNERLEFELSPEARSFMLTSAKTELMMPVIEDIYSIGSRSKWFVIYTDPQREQRACEGLAEKGIESYTPKTRDWRRQSLKDIHQKKPKIEIVRPLLVRYSFVRLPVRETRLGIEIPFGVVRLIEGVREIVGTPDGPITVSDEIVDMIREREQAGEFDNTIKVAIGKKRSRRGKRSHVHEAPRELKIDKETRVPKWVDLDVKARVLNGPFSMLMGVIEEILPNERVKLGIELFGRSTNIEIGIDALGLSE